MVCSYTTGLAGLYVIMAMLKLFSRNETIITNIRSLQIPVNYTGAVNVAHTHKHTHKSNIKSFWLNRHSVHLILVNKCPFFGFRFGVIFFCHFTMLKSFSLFTYHFIQQQKKWFAKFNLEVQNMCLWIAIVFVCWIHGTNDIIIICWVKCWIRFYFGINTINLWKSQRKGTAER